MPDILRDVIARSRAGEVVAIPSICSAHPEVLRASLALAERLDRPIVIEATSNQVNQEGGYTGQHPADFAAMVTKLAREVGASSDRIVLGGDHLGPQAWRAGPPDVAMAKAAEMVAAYVAAGFTKIHLDCSEGCAGEPAQLGDAQAAERAAALAAACHEAAADPATLLYVVGTEVPPPGGARADEEGDIVPTQPGAARATLDAHAEAFHAAGLRDDIAQIGGLVVQPGVEFSPMQVHHLPPERDPGLREATRGWTICLEAHSTDYQRPGAYRRLAELGFGFQKVGPALTFAWRQAIYALDILRGLAGWGPPIVQPVMERLMLDDPGKWRGHYHGDEAETRIARHFGLADRIRYYWPHPDARRAVIALREDLDGRRLAGPLLAQVFDGRTLEMTGGDFTPNALITAEVQRALRPYFL